MRLKGRDAFDRQCLRAFGDSVGGANARAIACSRGSFAPDEVANHRQAALGIRQTTSDLKDETRLQARVGQLRELVEWGEAWQQRLEFGARPVSLEVYEAFVAAIATSRKVLGDREPKAKDKLISLTDPDVRRNKHGEFYDGYLLDVMMDADSNLICGNVEWRMSLRCSRFRSISSPMMPATLTIADHFAETIIQRLA